MLERFVDSARRAMAIARRDATFYRSNEVTTAHVLLGLCYRSEYETDKVVPQLFKEFDITLDRVRGKVAIGTEEKDNLDYSVNVNSMVDLAKKLARRGIPDGQEAVLPEHLLLAIISDPANDGFVILSKLIAENDLKKGFVSNLAPKERLSNRINELMSGRPSEQDKRFFKEFDEIGVCPACDHCEVKVRFHNPSRNEEYDQCLCRVTHEHLFCTCQECGYKWLAKCQFEEH